MFIKRHYFDYSMPVEYHNRFHASGIQDTCIVIIDDNKIIGYRPIVKLDHYIPSTR